MACEIKDTTDIPLCSGSLEVLEVNAKLMDQYINSEEFEVPDRLGIPRKTWAGLEKDVQNALVNLDPRIEQLIAEKIIAQGGVEIADGWGNSKEKVINQDFITNNLGYVTPEMFGAVGDGVNDDTIYLQNCLNSSVDVVLNKKYRITSPIYHTKNTMITGGTIFLDQNSIFTSEFGAGLVQDVNFISNTSSREIIAISGKGMLRVNITTLIENVSSNSKSNVLFKNMIGGIIGDISLNGFDFPITFENIEKTLIHNIISEGYVRSFYFKDVKNSNIFLLKANHTSPNSRGIAGENGVLIESSVSNGTTGVNFYYCDIRDSGEHSYRLGGQKTISNVNFYNCKSYDSGSSIVINNPSSGSWSGGSGFKVLGGVTTVGESHKNITFNNCDVFDVNIQTGNFPTGHGLGNYCGFQFGVCEDIILNNCNSQKLKQVFSSPRGVEMIAVKNILFNNCNFLDSSDSAVRIYEQHSDIYPAYNSDSENIVFNNCRLTGRSNTIRVELDRYEIKGIEFNEAYLKGDINYLLNIDASQDSLSLLGDILINGRLEHGSSSFVSIRNAFKVYGDITIDSQPQIDYSLKNGSIRRIISDGIVQIRKTNQWHEL